MPAEGRMPDHASHKSSLKKCLLLVVLAMSGATSGPADPSANPQSGGPPQSAVELEQTLWDEPAHIPNLYLTWAKEIADGDEGAEVLDYAVEVASLRAKRVFDPDGAGSGSVDRLHGITDCQIDCFQGATIQSTCPGHRFGLHDDAFPGENPVAATQGVTGGAHGVKAEVSAEFDEDFVGTD